MAEEMFGKSLKQLKLDRTMAKSSFTKQANFLSRKAANMTEMELREEFKKLSSDARHVSDSNDDYKAGLLAELEDEAGELDKQQEADFEKTINDCESKFDEVKQIVQSNLWKKYGQDGLYTAIQEAEKACNVASDIEVLTVNKTAYEVQLSFVENMIQESVKGFVTWEKWIPVKERGSIEDRVKQIKLMKNKLQTRKSQFAIAQTISEEKRKSDAAQGDLASLPLLAQSAPIVKIRPICLPKFHGCRRNFHRWRKDWESLQKQGEPSGSIEVKKFQLLDSVDERICHELHLSAYDTAADMFRVMENRYGDKSSIALEIIEELEKIPPLKANQPRKVIDLIQRIEKALVDLTELGNIGAMKNPLVIKSLESKLPDVIKRDWLVFMVNPANAVTPVNHFDSLLRFLKTQEEVLEKLEQLGVSEKVEKKFERRHAFTRVARTNHACIVCGDTRHGDKIFFCKQFKAMNVAEKLNIVKTLKTCKRCLRKHEEDAGCINTYLCRNKDCKKGSFSDHHFLLCPKGELTKAGGDKPKWKNRLTEEQEKFIAELSPELAEECRKAFSNVTASTSNIKGEVPGLMESYGLKEQPVILMLLEVTANAGQKIGTLIDLASDTNYITHQAAQKLNLEGENITLVVHGVGGMSVKVRTRRYLLKVRVKTPKGTVKAHQLICYGLSEIAKVHKVIQPLQLQKFFPDVDLEDLKRPDTIELLISHREGRLAPQRVKVVGDLVLWNSPLGITVGGAHPDLCEVVDVAAHSSETHFARSMRTAAVKYEEICNLKEVKAESKNTTANKEFIDWWKWESIGAACEPKCGGCRCGTCQPGGKEMTLMEEKELEIIKQGLTYVQGDAHSDTPHWDAKYPWIVEPTSLPNNRKSVESTFLKTERRLNKEPEWKTVYANQVHEMVQRKAAIKLTEETLNGWKGPVWYVNHQVAPNPHSVTTPVRLVWNSSQRFEGLSMNDILLKGPDVLNPIRAVLLRFRRGLHAALGDIKKMYNSVWLEDLERHLHRFLWRDSSEEEIEISLDVDADRDGTVEINNPHKESWTWGPNGHGAILLVNCDAEKIHDKSPDNEDPRIVKVSDLKDMSLMVLRTRGPAELPEGYKLTMHISQGDAESVRVFRAASREAVKNSLHKLFSSFVKDYPLVLSSEVLSQEVPYLGGSAEMNFYVEGLRFPDKDFDGLITINLSLLQPVKEGIPETPIFTDKVVFRVSPWIMTPNTLQPVEVFVCSTSDNYQFLKGMKALVSRCGYKLKVCFEYMNRGDRWMQDELEFGYIDSPHHSFPVVLDSPRDGHLDDFPYDELLGPDFGYVTRVAHRKDVSSLDSFGNLEVSPPVTVNGKKYPLGRILIGVAFPTATKGRNMTKVVQDFLWAQKVQEPVALFSDWLCVGHIDEFMTFVPAPDRKGFRLLLASPDAAYKLFRGLHKDGHGQAKMFDGVKNEERVTVDDILRDENLRDENNYVQSCIDWNRDVLKRELGLDDDDIIDLPILFKLDEEDGSRAVAYYPDMVNMIVLGKDLGIPKPFGPKVDGRCALETEMCSLMEGLGLRCTFIDDFSSYHKLLGEVHCGSNVLRKPFDFKWWNLEL